MTTFNLTPNGTLVFGTPGQPQSLSGTNGGDQIIGADTAEIIFGGEGNDMLFGGAGSDTFAFARTTAAGQIDLVLDFHSREDHLSFSNVSQREVSLHDTAEGLEIWYGGPGGSSPNHGVALLWGVHQIQNSDLVFV
jgi:Ca2+-binding RTX toxin-like protein